MTSDAVNHSQGFFFTEDLKKICDAQVNEFVWKCPTVIKEKILKFRTSNDAAANSSTLAWYLKSINKIDIVEMDHWTHNQMIEFHVKINRKIISLSRLYPTYPEISGFEILQFITNLAFQCKFSLDVDDSSDILQFTLYSMVSATMNIKLKA
jgi:hypothetical protein